MSNGINLLGKKNQAAVSPAARKLWRMRLVAIWSLFVISGFSIILFLLIALSPLPALLQQEKSALATLASHHQEVAKVLFLQDRLQTTSQIIAKRPSFDAKLQAVQDLMPAGIDITEMSIDQKGITVTVSSSSLLLLDTFTNNLLASVDAKKDFSEVVMGKLFINPQRNVFSMTVSLTTL